MRAARQVVAAAREMSRRGMVVGSVGNVSMREPGGHVLITPTRSDYERLRPRDLVRVDSDGNKLSARGAAASRELPLHLAVYRARPDVGAVIHTHSPHATAWSFRGEPITPQTEEINYYGMGQIGCAPHAPAGSPQLGEIAADALGGSRAVLLGNHGVLAVGDTPADALVAAQVVEHQAQVAWLLAPVRLPGWDDAAVVLPSGQAGTSPASP